MKILITGSAGFIGFHVAKKLLKNGHKVIGYDSLNKYYDTKLKLERNKILKKYKNYFFLKGDLENKIKLTNFALKYKPNIIIHLAAQAGVRYSLDVPRKYISSNIIGTFNVIEIAHKLKIKHLLIASSSSVYGSNVEKSFKEKDKADMQLSIYAATKKSTENIAHAYSSLWKIPITMMRFFTVYGPWGRPDMAYFKFTNLILNNRSIDVYNNGRMFRDFTYIDDVTKSIELLINKVPSTNTKNKETKYNSSNSGPYRVVNIGNQKKIYLINFIKKIEYHLKKKASINYMPMQKGDVKQTLSDTKVLYNLTNYKTKINYDKGLSKFIDWFRKFYKI